MLALALEGGGAKGAFHMGAMKAFFEEGYEFDAVAGTSIGALNGAVIAQGDFELGYRWWREMDTSLLFDIENAHIQKFFNRELDRETVRYLFKKARNIIENKGVDTRKIRETIGQVIDEDKLRKSPVDFGIVTVSAKNLKPLELFKEDIPEGMMLEYLMASANFPAFKIEPIGGNYYLDGGFYDNCPINMLGRKGYREVIAIRTFGIGRIRPVEDKTIKVTYVFPSEDLGRPLDFSNARIQTKLKMGYCDAMRVIKNLKGGTYYIQPDIGEEAIIEALLSIRDETVFALSAEVGLPHMPPKRLLFERILPRLSRMLGLGSEASYVDIVIAVMEQVAQAHGIDRYEVRSLTALLSQIKNTDLLQDNQRGVYTGRLLGRSKNEIITKAGEVFIKAL